MSPPVSLVFLERITGDPPNPLHLEVEIPSLLLLFPPPLHPLSSGLKYLQLWKGTATAVAWKNSDASGKEMGVTLFAFCGLTHH